MSHVHFAVSYSFFSDRTPFLQHAAIAASIAAVRPLDSMPVLNMSAAVIGQVVARPSAIITALRQESASHPRARTINL